jgi:hypothetical protein
MRVNNKLTIRPSTGPGGDGGFFIPLAWTLQAKYNQNENIKTGTKNHMIVHLLKTSVPRLAFSISTLD